LKLLVAKNAFSCIFGGQSVTENELFMIMKLDVASSAVSPFFQNLMTGTGGYIRFYSQ